MAKCRKKEISRIMQNSYKGDNYEKAKKDNNKKLQKEGAKL